MRLPDDQTHIYFFKYFYSSSRYTCYPLRSHILESSSPCSPRPRYVIHLSLRVRVPTHLTNSPFDLVSSPSGSRLPSIRFLLRFKVKVLIRKMAQNADEVIQMQPLMPENQTSNDQTISIVASESIAIPNPTDTEENTNTFCCSRF